MNKTLLVTSLVWLSASTTVFAGGLALFGVFPNTVDDTNLEYIEVQNASCAPIQIAQYTLRDAAGSIFTLPNETLASGAIRRFMRSETHITLNNTDETLELRSPIWESIDTKFYATSIKWIGINFAINPYGSCTTEITTEVTTTVIQGSGSLSQTNSPQTGSGSWTGNISWTNSGTLVWVDILTASWTLIGSGSISSTGSFLGSGTTVGSWALVGSGSLVGNTYFSGTTNSGSLNPVNSNASLLPLLLRIIDLDRNGKVDRLSIEYSGTLTGALRLDKFVLYSSTGGLSSGRIDTGSWAVRSLTLSGSELLVDLVEQDLVHTDLRINATTESHLRVKTLSDFGLIDTMWTPVQPLTLTESFQKYAPAYIRNEAFIPIVPASTPSSTVFVTVNPSTLSPNPTIIPATPTAGVTSSTTPTDTQLLPPVLPTTTRIPPTIRVQSGVSPDGACRTSACSVNLVANWVSSTDVCQWLIIPKSGLQFQRLGCNPGAFLVGTQGWIVKLDVVWVGLSGFQSTLSMRGFTKMDSSDKKLKTSAVPPKSIKGPSKNSESIDIFEEYFEIIDPESEADWAKSTLKVSDKSSQKESKLSKNSIENAKKLSSKSTSKSAKKASATQPTTVKTTKTTKTTKVSKPPTPPKSIEKPQKNPVPTTPPSITPTTIGIVWLLCSALGFGVAIYRRRDS